MPTPRTCGAHLLAALTALLLTACGPDAYNPGPETCERDILHNPPVLYADGITQDGLYMTSTWDGELLWFPGGMHYKLQHRLGQVPRFFQPYVSFDRYGTDDTDGEPGTIALATGTQAELVNADTDYLIVRNAECVDYWLLVVAGINTPTP